MPERRGECSQVLRGREGDHGNPAAGVFDLCDMRAELAQVLLAEETAEMTQQDQDGRPAVEAAGGVRIAVHVPEDEIQQDPGHSGLRLSQPWTYSATFGPASR